MAGMYRSIVVFAVLGGAAFAQQKEVSGGYHYDHPDKPAATVVSNDKGPAKKAAAKKKMHSNVKRSAASK